MQSRQMGFRLEKLNAEQGDSERRRDTEEIDGNLLNGDGFGPKAKRVPRECCIESEVHPDKHHIIKVGTLAHTDPQKEIIQTQTDRYTQIDTIEHIDVETGCDKTTFWFKIDGQRE